MCVLFFSLKWCFTQVTFGLEWNTPCRTWDLASWVATEGLGGSLGVQRSLFPGTNLHQLGTGEETGGHQADKSPLSFSFPKTTPSVLSPYNPFRKILLASEHACWVTRYGSFQHVIQQELALQFIKSISLHLSLLLFLLPLPLQTWTSTSQRKH